MGLQPSPTFQSTQTGYIRHIFWLLWQHVGIHSNGYLNTPFPTSHMQIQSQNGQLQGSEMVFLMTMATVAKVTGPKYFSCNKDPKAHLHAKFHRPQTVNTRYRIMSYIFDCIDINRWNGWIKFRMSHVSYIWTTSQKFNFTSEVQAPSQKLCLQYRKFMLQNTQPNISGSHNTERCCITLPCNITWLVVANLKTAGPPRKTDHHGSPLVPL